MNKIWTKNEKYVIKNEKFRKHQEETFCLPRALIHFHKVNILCRSGNIIECLLYTRKIRCFAKLRNWLFERSNNPDMSYFLFPSLSPPHSLCTHMSVRVCLHPRKSRVLFGNLIFVAWANSPRGKTKCKFVNFPISPLKFTSSQIYMHKFSNANILVHMCK